MRISTPGVATSYAVPRRQAGQLSPGCLVDVIEPFPDDCRYVLQAIEVIYRNDALARERKLTAQERLQFHQAESGPTMECLREWLKRQLEERLVEPHSALGAAIQYLRNHWEKLTLFLRV